ncbi:FHA domain-containing protein [Kocuria coralli]|uniref:FHA domain-containing protein n=1 Tax=Kocuria coralli TaxID=1461025 RepID=A0A5J5KXS1_9MICC|nr:FHA domain-containing protein [Kocuria coralli]KAA9394444.1 FHA domain-containing protein [Kocuria coralli]
MTTPSERNTPSAGPETTSIQIVSDILAQAAGHRLSEEEQAAIEALPPSSALLVQVDSHGQSHGQGSRFLLDTDQVTVGRHPEADVFLDDVTVSRRHAGFIRRENSYELVDENSLNGTYVNNDRVDSVLLNNGDEVRLGKFCFIFYRSTRTAESRP